MGDYEYETDSGCLSVRVHLRDPKEKPSERASYFPYFGISELNPKSKLIRSLMAELIGTLLLVLIGCGSCTGGDPMEAAVQIDDQANIVRISLCFGITVATLAQTIGHVSGCHINPAITFGLTMGGKIGILKGLLYIIFQCIGAISGAGILYGIVYSNTGCTTELEGTECTELSNIRGSGGLGQTLVSSDITKGHAVAVEMLISGVLVLIVFAAAADGNNAPSVKGSAPLAIGLSITACHLWAIPLTGSSMNPARSLGPSIVMKNTGDLWVYWVGPLLGGLLAAILYQTIFRADGPEGNGSEKKYKKPTRRPTGDYYKKGTPANQVPILPSDGAGNGKEAEVLNKDDLAWIEDAAEK